MVRTSLVVVSSLALSGALMLSFGCERESSSTDGLAKTAQNAEASLVAPAPPAEQAGDCAGAEGVTCADAEEAGGCNQWDEAANEVVKRGVPDGAMWKTYRVDGMTCGGCERRVIANVGKLDGVVGVEADAELGQVRVATDPAHTSASADASEAIGALGYKVVGTI